MTEVQDLYPHANIPAIRTWAAKLREQGRKQAEGQLGKRNPATGEISQCCLDVACDVYRDMVPEGEQAIMAFWGNGGGEPDELDGTRRWYRYTDEDGERRLEGGVLPEPVARWFGFVAPSHARSNGDEWVETNPYLVFPEQGGGLSATTLNDTHRKTFAEIADIIDAAFPNGGDAS